MIDSLIQQLQDLQQNYLELAKECRYGEMEQNLREQTNLKRQIMNLTGIDLSGIVYTPEEQSKWVGNLDDESCRQALQDIAMYVARFNTPGAAFTDDDLREIILGLLDIIDQWGGVAQAAPYSEVRRLYESFNRGNDDERG